jgi:transposase
MNDTLQHGKEQGKLGIDEITRLMGTQLNLLQEEEKKQEEEKRDEEKSCPGCGRPLHKFHDCQINPIAEPAKRSKRDSGTR